MDHGEPNAARETVLTRSFVAAHAHRHLGQHRVVVRLLYHLQQYLADHSVGAGNAWYGTYAVSRRSIDNDD